MKVKEVDLSAYDYKRVCIYHVNSEYFAVGKEDVMKKLYGEEEVDHIDMTETGLLRVYTTAKPKFLEEQSENK